MPLTRTDYDEVDGVVVNVHEVDITAPAVTYDLHVKLRAYLELAKPTPADTARAVNALARLVVGDDLLNDNKGT